MRESNNNIQRNKTQSVDFSKKKSMLKPLKINVGDEDESEINSQHSSFINFSTVQRTFNINPRYSTGFNFCFKIKFLLKTKLLGMTTSTRINFINSTKSVSNNNHRKFFS